MLLLILLAPKSRLKQFRNHSKTHPKSIPKTHRNSTPLFIDFASEMIPEMRPKSFKKLTPGALRGHMGPKDAQKGGLAPPGDHFPQFRNRNLMFFHIVTDFVSTCNCLKSFRNEAQTDFASSSASHYIFLLFSHTKWSPKPLKTAILLK